VAKRPGDAPGAAAGRLGRPETVHTREPDADPFADPLRASRRACRTRTPRPVPLAEARPSPGATRAAPSPGGSVVHGRGSGRLRILRLRILRGRGPLGGTGRAGHDHRDEWGIPHITRPPTQMPSSGSCTPRRKTISRASSENFLVSQGRLAEAEGESEIWQDLRMQLFIDPVEMREHLRRGPGWLRDLMDAWADGLNFYLHTHPEVRPQVLDPVRALDGADLQRRKHRRRHRTGEPEGARGILRRPRSHTHRRRPLPPEDQAPRVASRAPSSSPTRNASPPGRTGSPSPRELTANGNALLLINPHTSFYFRHEAHVVSDEGLNVYGALTWGQFFVYQGFNATAGWMHTSSRWTTSTSSWSRWWSGTAALLPLRRGGTALRGSRRRGPLPDRPGRARVERLHDVPDPPGARGPLGRRPVGERGDDGGAACDALIQSYSAPRRRTSTSTWR
jgi:hypothetical protein